MQGYPQVGDPSGASVLEGVKILLVDSDQFERDLFTSVLTTFGATVVPASDERAVLEACSDFYPDVLIQETSGDPGRSRDLVRTVRARDRRADSHVPAIALVELGANAKAVELERGDDYQASIVKPVDFAGLLKLIANLTARRELTRRVRISATMSSKEQREIRERVRRQRLALEYQRELLSRRRGRVQGAHDAAQDRLAAPGLEFLSSLDPEEAQRIVRTLTPTHLEAGRVLSWPGDRLDWVYFPERSVIARLIAMEDGSTVEAGLVGPGGAYGVSACFGPGLADVKAQVLVGGPAWKIHAGVLREECARDSALVASLVGMLHQTLREASQNAACARFHTIEQRLARLILAVRDFTGESRLALTHEQISQVLGVRRAGVTVALGVLQDAGLIDCAYRSVRLADPDGLAAAACECLAVLSDAPVPVPGRV